MLTALRGSRRSQQSGAAADSPLSAAGGPGTDLRSYFACAVTRDGCAVAIRAIRPDDTGRLCEHFRSLSPTSAYFRFFGPKRRVSERELAGLTDIDFRRHVTLVATVRTTGAERIVGLGQYVVDDDRRQRAQLACSVVDEYQGRGIGTLLMEHLLGIARARGVVEFAADVLGDNHTMLRLLTKSGLAMHRSTQAGIVHLTFSGAKADRFLAAA
ncbi:MAG TPA: GNAT family N-acetyltransferase [Candidatus Binatia bacterium]|nr:GNAT family N-acetyltransferase [Candidatus Binatia bacterium]